MICPNCSSENPTSHKFCIHCGTPLSSSFQESELPNDKSFHKDAITNKTTSQDNQQKQLRTLQNDVRAIRDTLAGHGIVVPTQTLDQTDEPHHSNVSYSQETEQTASDNLNVSRKPSKHNLLNSKQINWELILGGNWLARIGVIAVIIGTGFFLKLAFDNNWIGEIGQVVIGIIAGLIFLYGGVYWQKKYPQYSQALFGGGIAILYLSIFAAVGPFELINFYPAMGLFLLISITAAGLAIRQESLTLAILGIIGAFAAPFTTGFFGESNEGIDLATKTTLASPSWHLMAYVIVIDIGILALSTFRHWRWFTLLGLLGSLATFTIWRDVYSNEISLLISQTSLTVIFLIFVAATTLFHIIWRRPPKVYDQSLMIINAIAFFGMSYYILSDDFNNWMGVFSVAMSIFYGTIAYISMLKNRNLVQLSVMSLGISLIFLTIAIPIQLNGAWVTIAWAAEAAILIWISFTLRMWQMRIFSLVAFSILSLRLIALEIEVNIEDFQAILNHRMLAFASGIFAFYVAAYIARIHYASLMNWEKQKLLPGLLLTANALSLLIISLEMITFIDANIADFSGSTANHIKSLGLSLLWAIYASILIIIGIIRKVRLIRLAGLILLAIPIIKLFIFDSFALEQGYRVVAFISLGLLLICGGFLYQRFNVVIKGFLSEN